MTALLIAIAVAVTLVALAGFVLVRPELAHRDELVDSPGIRSTLVFRLATVHTLDDDAESTVPPAELLDAIGASLERAGAEASHWGVVGSVLELQGMLGADTFKLTVGPIEEHGFVLVVHAHTLGRARWVAPPATDAMRALLRAIDRGVRGAPGVIELGWRQRQDDPTGEGVRPTPVD